MPGVLILDMIVLSRHLVRLERFEGLPRMVVRDLRDGQEWTVKFEEEAYSLGMSAGYEFDTATIRLSYSSPTTTAATHLRPRPRRRGAHALLKEQAVPSGHNADDYVTRRDFCIDAPDRRDACR